MWLKPEEVLLKNALKLWVTQKSSCYFVLQRRRGHGEGGGRLTGRLVGALDAVLDSSARVAPFRILLQVPGSQVYSPIACVKLVIPWVDIQKLERTSNVFLTDTIRITTQNKERDFSTFLNLDEVFKIMEQLADVTLRRLLDNEVFDLDPDLQEPSQITKRDLEARAQNEFFRAFFRLPREEKLHAVADCSLWTPFSRCHTAGRIFSSDSYICFASREDGCCNVVLPLREVVSIEKMEDTSLLPNPIIVSIRSKMAFQFIELKDRENLVEGLLLRLKQVHANHPVHYETSPSDDDMASPVFYSASICTDKFGDLEMVASQSSEEREEKRPLPHPEPLTAVFQQSGSQSPDSRLVSEMPVSSSSGE